MLYNAVSCWVDELVVLAFQKLYHNEGNLSEGLTICELTNPRLFSSPETLYFFDSSDKIPSTVTDFARKDATITKIGGYFFSELNEGGAIKQFNAKIGQRFEVKINRSYIGTEHGIRFQGPFSSHGGTVEIMYAREKIEIVVIIKK